MNHPPTHDFGFSSMLIFQGVFPYTWWGSFRPREFISPKCFFNLDQSDGLVICPDGMLHGGSSHLVSVSNPYL